MITALNTGASAVSSQETAIDTLANNIANINTTGFKQQRSDFADLLYTPLRSDEPASQAPLAGVGMRVAANQTIFSQGSLVQTGNSQDLAVDGDGFFQVTLPNGQTAYTRDGSFQVDGNGNLVTADGYPVYPGVNIPADSQMSVTSDGRVLLQQAGQTGSRQIAQLTLTTFTNPAGLVKAGDNLYQPSANSGTQVTGNPGSGTLGSIRCGFLESSNVDLTNAMSALIEAQRAYQANARVITNADTMQGIADNIRR